MHAGQPSCSQQIVVRVPQATARGMRAFTARSPERSLNDICCHSLRLRVGQYMESASQGETGLAPGRRAGWNRHPTSDSAVPQRQIKLRGEPELFAAARSAAAAEGVCLGRLVDEGFALLCTVAPLPASARAPRRLRPGRKAQAWYDDPIVILEDDETL